VCVEVASATHPRIFLAFRRRDHVALVFKSADFAVVAEGSADSGASKWCVRQYAASRYHSAADRAVRARPVAGEIPHTLSEIEEAELLSCCSPYLQDLVTFAMNTGLRLGDILNLKWEEVDLEKGILNTVVRKRRRMLEMPLNEKALSIANGWHGIRKGDHVFYNPETGTQWKDLWLGLKKACRKAGLPNVTWHTFRHTFASRLNGNGADLVTVKELLGHAHIKTTMRYAHTNREAKTKAVRRLDGGSDKTVTLADSGQKDKKSA
jgi:integrase